MDITFNTDQIREIVSEGILANLTDEVREDILRQAVAALITPPETRYSYGQRVQDPSPLQQAFNNAAQQVANELARELVAENAELRQRIKDQISDSLGQLIENFSVSNAITNALQEAVQRFDR